MLPEQNKPDLLDYSDYDSVRSRLFDRAMASVAEAVPAENDKYKLHVTDLKYTGPSSYSLSDQKKAILEGRSLNRKMTGVYNLTDVATGNVLSKTGRKTVLNVPYLTNRGTFIRNGVENIVMKQFRLSPGVYTRNMDDGNIESQFNVAKRTGQQFRIMMDPSSAVFYYKQAGRKIPLLPMLLASGYNRDALKQQWGPEIFKANEKFERSPHAISFLRQYQSKEEELPKEAADGTTLDDPYANIRPNLVASLDKMRLNDSSVERTMGVRTDRVTPDLMVMATRKLLDVHRGKADTDDRDSLAFQTIHDVTDFLPDKIRNDQNGVFRNLLWKITNKQGDLSTIPAGLMDAHVKHLFNETGLAQNVEGINPLDMYDQNQRVSRLGEGGIPSLDVVPAESRAVQPSYMSFVDPVRSPESLKIGVDMKLARNARKGPDNKLYTKLLDTRTGQPTWVSSDQTSQGVIGFPDFHKTKDKFVPAMVKAKGIFFVPREQVDYVMENGDDMFSDVAQTVPLKSGVKGMRLLMASKFSVAALPLINREAPYVQTTESSGGESMYKRLGVAMGAVRSPVNGIVKSVYKDHMLVEDADTGEIRRLDMYDDFPMPRKTSYKNTPTVKAGQRVAKGDLMATSNYTDAKGMAAPGMNLRTGYLNYRGFNFEDAVVISESAAKRLTSAHTYSQTADEDKERKINKKTFVSVFPSQYNRQQLEKIDDNGVVKKGQTLSFGDPMMLVTKEREPTPGTMNRRIRTNAAVTWQHHFPGVVSDVSKTKDGYKVYVSAEVPALLADKLSNSFGGKGVISKIVPDDEMPRDAQGRPLELLLSPLGITSRTNSAQLVEAALGKVAEKTGKRYVLPGFDDADMVEFAQNELKKYGLSDTEDIYDPRTKKTIPQVFVGNAYAYKLQHTSESKGKARSTAAYTAEGAPARGGKTGAKHLGSLLQQALLGHNATETMKDLKLISGQQNDSFWRQLKLGQTPVMPGTPMVYEKFKDMIRAAGVELREEKDADSIFAMTRKQVVDMTGNREITSGDTYGANSMQPVTGGLFDPDATGSLGKGDLWSYIRLPEPMPNPVMEDPMRRILGLKQKEFAALMGGETPYKGMYGGQALTAMLKDVDLKSERMQAIETIKNGVKSKRDDAVKKLSYIEAMISQGVAPTDFLMDRIPVLPPRFRPITQAGGMTMVADPNYLYKAILDSSEDFKDTAGMPDTLRAEARGAMYKNYKALVGMTDPAQPELQQKNVSGILSQMFGKGSPKHSMFQRRVLGTNIDLSGLGVLSPNPSLKMNEVGLPETQAWDLYEPFIIRYLVERGVKAADAAEAVANKSKGAYTALQEVVKTRPVLINRAPSLHKYSVWAMNPVLTKGTTVQIPPQLVASISGDFDGDTASFFVPISDKAVEEARRIMMPDKNLLSARDDRPLFVPSNEYLQGLYVASKEARKGVPKKKFKTELEAMQAYKRGDIRIDDPIEIG